jgi:hypothetical protein
MASFGASYDQPIFPTASSAFKRRRGRPRKEEQLQREELTERLLNFLETNYENYRNSSRMEFYTAAAEYLGDVEPGEVRLIFDKLIDAYVESRRRRIHPGRDRHVTQWFGRLDNLLHASGTSTASGNVANGEDSEGRQGRKRVSTVLEAFIGRGGPTGEDGDLEMYEDEMGGHSFEEQEHNAVQKAILRTLLANLQTQQQILELQRQQLELQQEFFSAYRAVHNQKLSELGVQDIKMDLGMDAGSN